MKTVVDKSFYLEVINSFASELLTVNTVSEAVWLVSRHAIAKLGHVDCVVYLLNEDDQKLHQVSAYGPKNPIDLDIKNPIKLNLGQGICGYVALSGVPEIINDTSKDDRYIIDDSMRYSEISVPILSDGKVIGIIDSEHPDKNYFTEQDLEIFTTIAAMTSVKIGQARVQEQLESLLIEKDVLLAEIHHRVQNNLAVISGLFSLQMNKTNNEEVKDILNNNRARLRSMSMIHNTLYRQKDVSKISLPGYLKNLGYDINDSFNTESKEIKIHTNIKDISLDLGKAIPCGIITNELIVNSFKHAFPRRSSGNIYISFGRDEKNYLLTIKDDGIGMAKDRPLSKTLGMELVQTFVEELSGTKNIKVDNGTSTIIKFPINPE